jgi:hypothetical protein
MNLKISQTEKQQILEMHKRAVKNNLWEQSAPTQQNAAQQQKKSTKPTIQADFNEGVQIEVEPDCKNSFGPSCMEDKTINLYDDSGRTVWDQTWRIVKYETANYGKQIYFQLNKDINRGATYGSSDLNQMFGDPSKPGDETGTMIYDCLKPDQFTVTYKGTAPEVSNEPRYNAVTAKLKQYYCPDVLNVQAKKADFAQNKSAQSGDAPQTA